MRDVFIRFLLIWLIIFGFLIVISFVINWDLFLQVCSASFNNLIETIFTIGLIIAGIFYLISIIFRR